MIISKTPYRISFFGGGTDYPAWYHQEEGAVLSTTIDKYCYISCRYLPPFFVNCKHRIVWSHIETVPSISEILHPAVREGLRYLGYDDSAGLEIHHQGDLPARSGIGSSSSFAVGLINALTALKGPSLEKRDLALKAIELEQEILNETVGSQDQVAAAYGGFNVIRFSKDSQFQIDSPSIRSSRLEELESCLMLLYTGTSRLSSEVSTELISRFGGNSAALRQMRNMVNQAVIILTGTGNLHAFGQLMHESWILKRSLSRSVTNPVIDKVYETARKHGALGGKLMGAGAAGFMIFYVPPEKQAAVKKALAHFLWVPFSFESRGSTLIHNDSPSEIPTPSRRPIAQKESRPDAELAARIEA